MSRLYHAIKDLAPRPDRVEFARVNAVAGGGMFNVSVGGEMYELPMAGDSNAQAGTQVAVVVDGETGAPKCILGPV